MSATRDLIAAALSAADELDMLYENAPVEQNSNDLHEAAAELRRLHALCEEMAAIVKSVACTILHTVPGEEDCRCSQCELAKEARVIYTKWKESK